MRFTRVAIGAVALGIGLLANVASANRFSTSSRNFRITWSSLTFVGSGVEAQVRCPVTLEGSFHSATITKVRGALIGLISRASIASALCTGGTASFLTATLPWHRTYSSFSGSLPAITHVHYLEHKDDIAIEFGLGVCLYREDGVRRWNILIDLVAGVMTTVVPDVTSTIPKASGGIFCPEGLAPQGTGVIKVLATTTNITVRLI